MPCGSARCAGGAACDTGREVPWPGPSSSNSTRSALACSTRCAATTARIETLPAQVLPGTHALALEMHRLVLIDTSGIAALRELHRQLKRRGVALVLVRVNEQPLSLIRRSGFEAVLGAERIVGGLNELDAALR